jgi:hypothetical protein
VDTIVGGKLQQLVGTVDYYKHLQHINKLLRLSEMNDSFFL